jgi:HSP20 family protein
MTLSKRLLITLGTVPLLAYGAVASAHPKEEKPCEQGCPFWSMDELESFFNRPFPKMSTTYSASTLKESEKAYLISIDLPGMDKKDISIQTSGNRLMISGERKEESEGKEGSKKSYRQFNQSFSLPDDANLEAITAQSINGVLKITVPRTGKSVSRKIEIK